MILSKFGGAPAFSHRSTGFSAKLFSSFWSELLKMRNALFLLMIIPGVAGVVIFGNAALTDWQQLRIDYRAYEDVLRSTDDLSTLFKAEAAQNIQRINLFADGVWTLLSGILGAIGLHGWLSNTKS